MCSGHGWSTTMQSRQIVRLQVSHHSFSGSSGCGGRYGGALGFEIGDSLQHMVAARLAFAVEAAEMAHINSSHSTQRCVAACSSSHTSQTGSASAAASAPAASTASSSWKLQSSFVTSAFSTGVSCLLAQAT